MTIRKATPLDLEAVRQCAIDAYSIYVERIGKKPAPMDADFDSIQMDGNLYVLEENAQVKGFVVFFPKANVMHLENIAVSPAAHGSGYGSQLIEFVEAVAKEQGYKTLELYTNEKMVENFQFYLSRGFEETGRWKEDGFNRVFYRKRLTV